MRSEWIRRPLNDACVVFVHGILSSGEACWLNGNGNYWPHLVRDEEFFSGSGIYVFTYQTGIFSGSFSISNVVDNFKEFMRIDGVIGCRRLIFVCHSMGGIVVRKYLVERAAELIALNKEIALFLVASPSLGSAYADWLAPLANLFGHSQAQALRLVENNQWLQELDKEFLNLKEERRLPLRGKELVEDKFIVLPKLWRGQVVPPFAGRRFFGDSVKIPGSDHFSIAKPENRRSFQHLLLCDFLQNKFITPSNIEVHTAASIAPLWVPARSQGSQADTAGVHFVLSANCSCVSFSERIAAKIEGAGMACWLPERDEYCIVDPLRRMDEVLRRCESLILVLDVSSDEFDEPGLVIGQRAITYNKPITILHPTDASACPLSFYGRKQIHFAAGDEHAFRVLIDRLKSLATPIGQWETLSEQLVSLRMIERYASEASKVRYAAEIRALEQQKLALGLPSDGEHSAKERIAGNLERERRAAADSGTTAPQRLRVVNAPPLPVPHYFENRQVETGLVGDFLRNRAASILTVHGRGGVGKTALVCRVLLELERNSLPDNGGAMAVAGVVYINATRATTSLVPGFLLGVTATLEAEAQAQLKAVFNSLNNNQGAKLNALLAKLPHEPTVVLIDNFENLVAAEDGTIIDRELRELLDVILDHPRHTLKVIITTRVVPDQIAQASPARQLKISLSDGLRSPHAERVLEKLDFDGSAGLRDADEETLTSIATATRGFPRALEAFYSIIAADPAKEIGELITELRAAGHSATNLTRALVADAYSRLQPMETKLMEALAIFSLPVSLTALEFVLGEWAPYVDSATVLRRLVAMHFVRRKGKAFDLHPVDRDYVLCLVSLDQKRDLSGRAADYYREIQKPRAEWVTIADIESYLQQFRLRLDADAPWDAASILECVASFLIKRGAFEQTLTLARSLLSSPDRYVLNTALRYMAQAQWRIGRGGEAVAIQERFVANLRAASPDQYHFSEEGNFLIYRKREGIDEALLIAFHAHLERCKELYPNDWAILAICNDHIADCYQELGYLDEALATAKSVQELVLQTDDLEHQEGAIHNLGVRYAAMGRLAEAEACYRQALDLAGKSHNPLWKANHLTGLARCAHADGMAHEARQLLTTALDLRREIGDLEGCAYDLRLQSEILLTLSDFDGALKAALQARDQAQVLAMPMHDYMCTLAEVLVAQNRIAGAHALLAGTDLKIQGSRWEFNNLLGIILVRQLLPADAQGVFLDGIAQCDLWLSRSANNPAARAGKALGLSGLAACGDQDAVPRAKICYRELLAGELGRGTRQKWKRQLQHLSNNSLQGPVAEILAASFSKLEM